MIRKATLKYAMDVNIFNLIFSAIIGVTSGFPWFLVSFCSVGILVGLVGFRYFKNNEYYMYYNLGYDKTRLIFNVLGINILIALLLSVCYIIFFR